ncbi:hypothetical protein P170DRAFT_340091, partial [Aspergillus steynii IBT 23096]
QIFLCTNQVVDTHLVRNFGNKLDDKKHKSRGIIVIADEDGQCLEPEAWIPVAVLKRFADIKAMVRFGDRHQLSPVVVSHKEECYNEFASQLSRSLLDRTLRKLVNGPGTKEIEIPAQFDKALVSWIRNMHPEFDFRGFTRRLVGVHAPGECCIDDVSRSRYNDSTLRAVMSLVEMILKDGPIDTWTFSIIVPYAAQRTRYIKQLGKLYAALKMDFEHRPKVLTIDSAQGHESDVVIIDWTISSSDTLFDIGFVTDNRRTNVALTRARSCLVSVGNSDLASGNLSN